MYHFLWFIDHSAVTSGPMFATLNNIVTCASQVTT